MKSLSLGGEMATQARKQRIRHDEGALRAPRDSLYDGIGHRPIRPPSGDQGLTHGSPWALAPWPLLEIVNAVRDGLDRHLPGRGNRELIAAAGTDPQARLEAVMRACVLPALGDVRDQLVGEGYDVELGHEEMRVVLYTRGFNGREITYAVEGGVYREPVFSLADTPPDPGHRCFARVSIVSRGARHGARLHHCSRAAMRRHALHELRDQMLY